MNAIDLLKNDHRRISEMVEQLDNRSEATASRSQSEIFDRLVEALKAHTEMEERAFYPALERFAPTRAFVAESYREHDQVEQILTRMTDLKRDQDDAAWQAQFNDLERSVEQHITDEERHLFPLATELLDAAQLQEMFYEMDRVRTGQRLQDSLIYPASRFGPKK